jgi:hypothetical protein
MNLEDIMAKQAIHKKTNIRFQFYELSKVDTSIGTKKVEWWLPGAEGREKGVSV